MSFRCAHISDVHWRGLTRHKEYIESFTSMFEKIRSLDPDVIFIGGDIVHSKTQGISPELIDCLSWWFTEMARICPVHIILGNHDGLIMNKDRQDAISPIVSALNNDRIHLYKKSGVYPTGVPGYNWCVFSCFDEEGWNEVKPVDGDINIAAFHGGVQGSETDINWVIEGDVDLDFFSDYDFTFLGDIHRLQYMDRAGRVAYPGSTIQQNYGEDQGKGFLFWEIEDRDTYKSTFHKVSHSRPFVTVDWMGDVTSTVRECMKHPDRSRFRIRRKEMISAAEIKQLFGELREIKKATEIVFKNEHDYEAEEIDLSGEKFKAEDLHSLATHNRLMRDYYSSTNLTEDEWKKLDLLTSKYFKDAVRSDCARNIKWSVKKMEFDNTFSYGKENVINFDELRGITGIFGRNRSGKSSIPGTLMYCLYNSTDRGPISNIHIVNMRKGHCEARVSLTANGKHYKVERQTVKKTNKRGTESAVTHLNFSQVDQAGEMTKDLNGDQRRTTEKIVRSVVGTADDFLLTSLASQGEMNNFIKYKASARKAILTKFLDLEIFDAMCAAAKSDASEIKGMLSGVPDRDWDVVIDELAQEIKSTKEEKARVEGDLTDLRLKLQRAQIDLATSVDADLITQQDLDERSEELKVLQESLLGETEKWTSLKETIEGYQEKIVVISNLKSQFPVEELKERYSARQDLERNLLQLEHSRDVEKKKVKDYKKSIKLLQDVPCGDSFPMCKFIKNSHEDKRRLEEQTSIVADVRDRLLGVRKALGSLDRENLKEKLEKYEKILEKERDLRILLSEKQMDLSRVSSRLETMRQTCKDIEKDVESMKHRVVDTEEAERTRIVKGRIRNLTAQVNSADSSRMTIERMLGNLETRLDHIKGEKVRYSKMISDWKVYGLFINAVSKNGIPLKIMSVQLPAINSEIAKILQGVVGFTVELEADPKSNDMDIYINYGDSKRIIECGSGMEKMMASLAIRVALINVTTLPKSDLLIIDEGFGALDDMNVEACTRLLRSLKKWFKTILVISHVDAVKDSVDNVLDITHSGKNARVVYE